MHKEKRKVTVEFVSRTHIRITTPYKQRDFRLDPVGPVQHGDMVDLITLERTEERTPFHGIFLCEDQQLNNFSEWQLSLYAKVNLADMLQYDLVDVTFSDKRKVYETQVWVD